MKKISILITFILTICINIGILVFFDIREIKEENIDSKSVLNNNVSILKVHNDDVFNLLTDEEIKIIDDSLSNLCISDAYIIKNGLNSKSNEEIVSAFKLMKRRLTEEEYNSICEIFDKIFDIKQVEHEILNKI